MGRPIGSKDKFPRGAKKQIIEQQAILDGSDPDGDAENEISEEEAREGALTTEGRQLRGRFDRIIEAKRTGRGKGIKMDLPPMDLWDLCVKMKGADRTKVYLERIRPGEASCDVHHVRNIPEYQGLIDLIKSKYWDGNEQTYRWTFRDSFGRHVAANQISLPEDPTQKAVWANREAQMFVSGRQAVQAAAAAPVPVAPVQQMQTYDPRLDVIMRTVERLEGRLERGQQSIDEPQDEPEPVAMPMNPQPQGEWEWSGQTWVWKMSTPPIPPKPVNPPSPPPNYGWPPPGQTATPPQYPNQQFQPQQMSPWGWGPPQQPQQQAPGRELTELARTLAITEGEISGLKEQIKRMVEVQQHPPVPQPPAPIPWWVQQAGQAGQSGQMGQAPQMMQQQQPPAPAPSASTLIKDAKETVSGLAELAMAMGKFSPKDSSASSSVFGSMGGSAEAAAEKTAEIEFPIRPLDAGGWQMWFNTETKQPVDVASQIAMNLGNITEGGTKLIGSIFDNLKKMREEESGTSREKREMIAYMRQQEADKRALQERVDQISRTFGERTQTFDSPVVSPSAQAPTIPPPSHVPTVQPEPAPAPQQASPAVSAAPVTQVVPVVPEAVLVVSEPATSVFESVNDQSAQT